MTPLDALWSLGLAVLGSLLMEFIMFVARALVPKP